MNALRSLLLGAALLPLAAAAGGVSVEQILAREQAPPGVVFEILAWDAGFLEHGLPRVRRDIARLRARFGDLPVAVVSHGAEMFSLATSERPAREKVHSLTRQLVADDVPLYVCGTFAGWRGLAPEDFPQYVEVAASGPAKVNDYLNLDYLLVEVP